MGLVLLSAHVQLGRVRISSSSLLWVDLRCSACFAPRDIQVSLYSALVGLGCREGGAGCRTSDTSVGIGLLSWEWKVALGQALVLLLPGSPGSGPALLGRKWRVSP